MYIMNTAQFISAWIHSNKTGISVKLSGKQTCNHIKIHATLWMLISMNLLCCAYPRLWGRWQWFITLRAVALIGWWRTVSPHYASWASFHLFSYSLFIVCPWHHQSPGSTVYKHSFGWQKINCSANDVKSIKLLLSCILKPPFKPLSEADP